MANQPADSTRWAGSAGPASISVLTASGTTTSSDNWRSQSAWPTLAKVISGDALTTQRSATVDLREDLVGVVTERSHVVLIQSGQETHP